MASDLGWSEVGTAIGGILTGIWGAIKLLPKIKGEDVASKGLESYVSTDKHDELRGSVDRIVYQQKLTEYRIDTFQTILNRHDTKLDNIQSDLSDIKAAVTRRDD